MRKALTGAVALMAAMGLLPAGAQGAEPPEGARLSDNLEYVTRMADARGITEGKFDRVGGKQVLVTTGRFGFKTYDVSDPANPEPLDTFLPPDIAEFGYWQNEDMELDTRRKLIIGALDPRHTDNPLGACPGPVNGSTGGSVRNPAARAASTSSPTPTRPSCASSASSSTCPRGTPRAASSGAATSGRAGRRGATTRTG